MNTLFPIGAPLLVIWLGTDLVIYFLSTPRDPCHPTLKTSPRELARDATIVWHHEFTRSLHMESVGCHEVLEMELASRYRPLGPIVESAWML